MTSNALKRHIYMHLLVRKEQNKRLFEELGPNPLPSPTFR